MGQVSVSEDEETPVLINTPTYVALDAFMLSQHEEERNHLTKTRRHTGRWSVVITACIAGAFGGFISSVQTDNIVPISNHNLLLVSIGLMGLALAGVVANWIKSNERIGELLWRNRNRIERAQKLLKHHAYFGDTHKQWKGYKQSVADVDHWCKMNRIPAKIALYEDPMFGEFGIYISFDDWHDEEANEENLLFFRLKFL